MYNQKKIAIAHLNDKGGFNQEKVEGHSTIIKMLPRMIKVKGCNLPGLISTLVERTEEVGWYVRSDGYHEVFMIRTGKTFDESELMEYYPGTNDIGKTAWCIQDEEDAARYYANLCLGAPVDERTTPETYKDTIHSRKCKIR